MSQTTKTTKITNTPEQTQEIASEFARSLHGGELVFLQGDLGAGKTTFVQGLVGALGYTEPVRSPTFALMHLYPVDHGAIKRIVHLDLYRLKDRSELRAFGLEEFLHDSTTIVLVEWPENGFDLETVLPDRRIVFTIGENDKRLIELL